MNMLSLHKPTRISQKPFQTLKQQWQRKVNFNSVTRRHKVEIEHQGETYTLEVGAGQTILEVALDEGLELPHDCKMGVCMTCPAKLVEGNVDQSASIMSEEVAEKGYALLCVAEPQGDCKIKTIPEDELLDEQLVTSSM
eukprot:TRINITY_DN16832_c0_g1_i2.p2 TRINITY_DN16832_c0_g1~~TRINITY_DN16832_c0_g1_i2.p2  ORF type:complete len:139 (+),score=15.68 TRINITY_DN16832_c0_g1_i2:40-456(+)